MTSNARARTAPQRIRLRRGRVGLLVAVAAIATALGHQSLTSSSSSGPTPPTTSSSPTAAGPPVLDSQAREAPGQPHRQRGALGEAGGDLPNGTTVFDGELPGIANLDPALLDALRHAATDAGGIGIDFVVNSGWRSPAYEDQLRREAIVRYGSEAEAARWVATGTTSPHVSGDAVDLGRDAASWLVGHGAAFGLCQIYANEPWHYELRPGAIQRGCPAMYADPTRDPRMQRR